MDKTEKCPHGVYKAGHEVALNCGMCTPLGINDCTLVGLPKFKPSKHGAVSERTLSVSAFLSQPMGARLASAATEEAS